MDIKDLFKKFINFSNKKIINKKNEYYIEGSSLLLLISKEKDNLKKETYLLEFITLLTKRLSETDLTSEEGMIIEKEIKSLFSYVNSIINDLDDKIFSNAYILMSPDYVNHDLMINNICSNYTDDEKVRFIETALKLKYFYNKDNLNELSVIINSIKNKELMTRIKNG